MSWWLLAPVVFLTAMVICTRAMVSRVSSYDRDRERRIMRDQRRGHSQ